MTRIKQNDYTPKLGVVAQPRDVISTTPLTPMRTADIAGAFSDVLPSLMQARKDYNDEKIKDYEAMARRGEALTDEQSKDWRAIEAYERIGARRSLAEADVKFTELLAKTKGDLPAFEKGKTEMLDSLLTNASDTFANEIGDRLHALTSRYTAQAVRLNEQELATELKADAQGTLLSQINAEMPPGLDLSSSTKAFSSYEKALQAIKATDVRGMISTMQKDYMDLSYGYKTRADVTQDLVPALDFLADQGFLMPDHLESQDESGVSLKMALGAKADELLAKSQARRSTLMSNLLTKEQDRLDQQLDTTITAVQNALAFPDAMMKQMEVDSKQDFYDYLRLQVADAFKNNSDPERQRKWMEYIDTEQYGTYAERDDELALDEAKMRISQGVTFDQLQQYRTKLTEGSWQNLKQMYVNLSGISQAKWYSPLQANVKTTFMTGKLGTKADLAAKVMEDLMGRPSDDHMIITETRNRYLAEAQTAVDKSLAEYGLEELSGMSRADREKIAREAAQPYVDAFEVYLDDQQERLKRQEDVSRPADTTATSQADSDEFISEEAAAKLQAKGYTPESWEKLTPARQTEILNSL